MNKPHGHVKASHAPSIAIARFDILAFAKRLDVPFPVMHRSLASLRLISESTGLTVTQLDDLPEDEAVRVEGDFCQNSQLHIDSVWVSASSKKYRAALEERAFKANLISTKFPSDLHVDHVLNRGSLKKMIAAGCQPWVLLFEVPASANINFGSKIERHLPQFEPGTGQRFLNSTQLFKLLCTDWPRSQAEFQESLRQLAGQGVNALWIEEIRSNLGGLFT